MADPLTSDLHAIQRIDAVQRILEVVCRTTGLGFSAVARVTEDRWIACAVRDNIAFGLPVGGELPVETTICNSIRQTGRIVAIDHVTADKTFCVHPTPKMYGFESYISVPITLPGGRFFGTLCAIDPKPAVVNSPQTIEMFRLFSDLIAQHLDALERVAASERALEIERETANFREQFMAVLGHDLRNPLAAIRSGADVLAMTPRDAEDTEVIKIIQRSAGRMNGLIDNVLDFARGRLGGGLPVHRVGDARLTDVLRQVVNELRTAWPDRQIADDIDLDGLVACDAPRIGQMLSNLVANALTHGDAAAPVRVTARIEAGNLSLCVSNQGKAIPPGIIEHLFKPFARGTARPGQQGLGLGLYIASQIAEAHDGSLSVTSTDAETCFAFRMPVAVA